MTFFIFALGILGIQSWITMLALGIVAEITSNPTLALGFWQTVVVVAAVNFLISGFKRRGLQN